MEVKTVESKSERTKAFIIEKVAPLFNKKGYVGTSLSDMIAVTGLSKGSIYGNFKNKNELAKSVFEYNIRQVSDLIAKEIRQRKTAQDKLLVFTWFYRKYQSLIQSHGGCPYLNSAVEADDNYPFLKEEVKQMFLIWKGSLIHIISKGIERREFKDSINPEKQAITFMALIEGGIAVAGALQDYNHLDTILDRIESIIETEFLNY